ncbi:hypothetical protein [Roseateles sp. BYS96W]|jgi:hypothetical protein|uniref:Uncharacterized protein n=1 Tax=Pelomonas nitida TaxID=3299027 RepID=A0ABW7G9W5_9BURK
MKLFAPLAAALIVLGGPAHAADEHGHDHKPLHGGVLAESGATEYELVAKPDAITLHAREKGKPVNVQGARAKLTILSGGEQSVVELKPANDRLQAAGSFKVAAGSKIVATVELQGRKPANLRFAIK